MNNWSKVAIVCLEEDGNDAGEYWLVTLDEKTELENVMWDDRIIDVIKKIQESNLSYYDMKTGKTYRVSNSAMEFIL